MTQLRADGVRVACPLFQADGGGSIPTSALQLHFRECGLDTVRRLNFAWHSRQKRFGKSFGRVYFAAEFDGLIYAVAFWSNPCARALPQQAWIELRRFAISSDRPPNTGSRMLGWMARELRRKFPAATKLISYQDRDAHEGTIYKAAGWTPVEVEPYGGQWSHRKCTASGRVRNKVRWEKDL